MGDPTSGLAVPYRKLISPVNDVLPSLFESLIVTANNQPVSTYEYSTTDYMRTVFQSTLPPYKNGDLSLKGFFKETPGQLAEYNGYSEEINDTKPLVNTKNPGTWEAIVDFFKNNQQLQKKYSKNLLYMLQKHQQCINSYSTVVLMVIAYPRHRQKNKELSEQFIIDSRLNSHFFAWSVSACKSYSYLSPEEYIKLLNTHAERCFVSHVYPRFRALTDERELGITRRQHNDTIDGDDDDDDNSSFTSDEEHCDGGDDSSTTTTSSNDEEMMSSDDDIIDSDDNGRAGGFVSSSFCTRPPQIILFSPHHTHHWEQVSQPRHITQTNYLLE